MPCRQHPRELMKRLTWGRVESTGYYLNALVEHDLGLTDKCLIVAGVCPELASVREDGEAYGVEDEPSICHGEAPV